MKIHYRGILIVICMFFAFESCLCDNKVIIFKYQNIIDNTTHFVVDTVFAAEREPKEILGEILVVKPKGINDKLLLLKPAQDSLDRRIQIINDNFFSDTSFTKKDVIFSYNGRRVEPDSIKSEYLLLFYSFSEDKYLLIDSSAYLKRHLKINYAQMTASLDSIDNSFFEKGYLCLYPILNLTIYYKNHKYPIEIYSTGFLCPYYPLTVSVSSYYFADYKKFRDSRSIFRPFQRIYSIDFPYSRYYADTGRVIVLWVPKISDTTIHSIYFPK